MQDRGPTGVSNDLNEAQADLPLEYLRSGLISSNTYQVNVTVYASNDDQAMSTGLEPARARARTLMYQEHAIPIRMRLYAQSQIKRLVEDEGRIVRVQRLDADRYIVVMQVFRRGLRGYLHTFR